MTLTTDGYTFNFPNAIELFKFDEKDKSKLRYHGAPMKGVDVVVEFQDKYLFIEVKDFHDQDEYNVLETPLTKDDRDKKNKCLTHLKEILKYKLRDSFLYRNLEGKTDKPIHYICLLNFDSGLNLHLQKTLAHDLPVKIPKGVPNGRWGSHLAVSFQVLNFTSWNKFDSFKNSQLSRT